jgi:3-deoxy-D-manno-octulosonic-acid transferase
LLRIYRALQPALLFVLRVLARISPKFASLLEERQGLMDRWRKAELGENRIWVHVSSVGELEQARPVIDHLRAKGHSIVLSYFSTSVPKLLRDWSFVTYADYLPLDRREEMRELMALIRPKALVLNRYDVWPNHVLAAQAAGVPVILINASTPPLGWFGWLSLALRSPLFACIDGWTFVDSAAAAAWEPYISEPARGLVAGNPRVDRALARAEQLIREGKTQSRLRSWEKKAFCLVAGSTWPADEKVLLDAWAMGEGEKSLVIVPHEPDEHHLERLEKDLKRRGLSFVRFTRLGIAERCESEVLIVDARGFLAEIYGMGQLAYVGGGFGRQIHSIIEPIAHGLPVAFGPHFDRFPEAYTLWAAGAACALRRRRAAGQLAGWISEMRHEGKSRQRSLENLRVFLQMHRGAGERVGGFVEARLKTTDPDPTH